MTTKLDLTDGERDLLQWLAREQYSQFGECHGKHLDSLIARGFITLHEDGGELGCFIAKGRGAMYNSVSLTDKGRRAALVLTSGGND